MREIKEGMGVHSPRIEELAAHKLRFQEPSLTSQWVDMQEAHRRHQALLRKMEQDKKKLLMQGEIEQVGRGAYLGLSLL